MAAVKSANFTLFEKDFLKELIIPHVEAITSSTNDKKAQKYKADAWSIIIAEYNACEKTTQRTVDQLKKLWKNIRSRCKDSVAKEKKERRLTGGGKMTTIACDLDHN